MKTIGKYEVCGLLGKGGMGVVYKARIPVINRIVALKLLHPHPFLETLVGMEELKNLFCREAVIMARLRHPNILSVSDYDTHDSMPFFLMEYYCNNLGQMIGEDYEPDKPSRKIRIEKAIFYCHQVLLGLQCLHESGIIHRDIKPFNILITDDNMPKITDFGLSRLRKESFKAPENLKVGSPYYAAPEQENNPDAATSASDLFSVGVMLYRMITGFLPENNPRPMAMHSPELGSQWDDFFAKALHPNPAKRFSSADNMAMDLEALLHKWQKDRENACAFAPEQSFDQTQEIEQATLRREPAKVRPGQAEEYFGLDNLDRPEKYIRNRLEDQKDGTVKDHATGLLWQKTGTRYPRTWHQAHEYVEQLNKNRFAGHDTWRLPTINELMSILTPVTTGQDLCIPPVFGQSQRWLWSADTCSYTTAWYVSADMGFVGRQDRTAYYDVRPVS